jgi:tRNA G10  N-methylase Trm11
MQLEKDSMSVSIDLGGDTTADRPRHAQQAFPVDTTAQVQALVQRYERTKRAIPVSFRKLVPWLKVGERATHYIHPYPAKLLPHIAHFFLASKSMCTADGLVLDPFGGSGTVALESCLSGRKAAYADSNPLARLIAETKLCTSGNLDFEIALINLANRFKLTRSTRHPAVVNIKKWFQPEIIRGLSRLKAAIEGEPSNEMRRLLETTFSATVRRVSNADPRLSVPVLDKHSVGRVLTENVWARFSDQFTANVKRIKELAALALIQPQLLIAGSDARRLTPALGGALAPNSVDLVITSPPYAGAQKYIRASSLSLGWLGIAQQGELKPLENTTIGREHLSRSVIDANPMTTVPAANRVIARIRKKNPTRAAICAIYLNETEEVLNQLEIVLKPGGRLVLVIGNNEVCGESFLSSDYLCSMLLSRGFRLEIKMVDEIKSRGLMTKRNRSASIITREWVLVFQK